MLQTSKGKAVLQEKFISKWLRIVTKNQRIFEGKLMCVDYKSNLILHEAVAEIHPTQNCPLNYDLENIDDQKLQYTLPVGLSPEEALLHRREYFGTHYYLGQIMITGTDIVSIEIADKAKNQPQTQPQPQIAQQKAHSEGNLA